MTTYTIQPFGRGGYTLTGDDDHVYGFYATEDEARKALAEAMSTPEEGDHVRVTPMGYAGWVSGIVHRIRKTDGAVEVDCDTHGCFMFSPSDVQVYRKAGE